jgi:N-formylglutamate deformylase
VAARALRYWQPYHQTLQAQLQRLRALHPAVLLWDGHSIRSHCPMFFDGRLPDYNIGTADGASCDSAIQDALAQDLRGAGQSFVVNGRFKGGYITRHFGAPASGIHAVQMEMAQASYLDETEPGRYDPALAQDAQAVLRRLLQTALAVLPSA